MSRHECDCGVVYTNLEHLYRCQANQHWQNRGPSMEDRLAEALQSLIHRCEAEGCGTAWAPITDAKDLLKERGVV